MTRHNALAISPQTAIAAVLTAIAAGTLSAPSMAQDPVRDFNLPPGETPTPTPVPIQGPVDDTGPVPIRPRPIETDAPVPQPLPSPAAPQTQTPSEVPTPTRTPGTGAVVEPLSRQTEAPAPRQSPTPSTASPPASTSLLDDVFGTPTPAPSSASSSPPFDSVPSPNITASQGIGSAEASETSSNSWVWIAGGLATFLALLAGVFFFLRRKASTVEPPTIEPPIVNKSVPQPVAADKGRFALEMKIVSIVRSVMMVTVKAQVTVANRSDRALRDLAISGDLISANKSTTMDQQIAREGMALAPLITLERIGPNKTQVAEITLQMSTGQIDGFHQGNVPMFVPLARIIAECDSADPQMKTFVLGVEAPGSKLHPLPLNGMPGEYQGVGSRPVA